MTYEQPVEEIEAARAKAINNIVSRNCHVGTVTRGSHLMERQCEDEHGKLEKDPVDALTELFGSFIHGYQRKRLTKHM